MRLRFTRRAAKDLSAIAAYVREHNPAAAEGIRATILEALHNLQMFPRAGRRQTIENVYKFVTRKHGYIIYYALDVSAGEIAVLSFQHSPQAREYADI